MSQCFWPNGRSLEIFSWNCVCCQHPYLQEITKFENPGLKDKQIAPFNFLIKVMDLGLIKLYRKVNRGHFYFKLEFSNLVANLRYRIEPTKLFFYILAQYL